MSKGDVAYVLVYVVLVVLITLVSFGHLDIDTAVPMFIVLAFVALVVGVIRHGQGRN